MAEVVVAVVVVGILAVTTVQLLISTLDLSGSNARRVAAGNLATRQIELARSKRALDIPNGTRITTQTVGGTTYTVQETVTLVMTGSSTSACIGTSGKLANKLVIVTVAWPNMGSARPARADTLKALGGGSDGLGTTTGAVAVIVNSALGQPQSGVPVTLTPGAGTQTTSDDGCVVFTGLAETTYTATATLPGWVGINGGSSASAGSIGVTRTNVTRATLDYDRKATLAVTLAPPNSDYTPPATLGVTLYNTLFSPTPRRSFPDCSTVSTSPQTCVSGVPRAATALFPGSYTAWAGTCLDGTPAPLPNFVTVAASAAVAIDVPLAGVRVNVRSSTDAPVTGRTVYAIHASNSSGCTTGEVWSFPTGALSTVAPGLPAGQWKFALTANGSGAPASGWPTVTLARGVNQDVIVRTS